VPPAGGRVAPPAGGGVAPPAGGGVAPPAGGGVAPPAGGRVAPTGRRPCAAEPKRAVVTSPRRGVRERREPPLEALPATRGRARARAAHRAQAGRRRSTRHLCNHLFGVSQHIPPLPLGSVGSRTGNSTRTRRTHGDAVSLQRPALP
jgi:hypothetical protein